MQRPDPPVALAREPITERLAAMEVEVRKLTTYEEWKAQDGAWSKSSNSLTNGGRARLCALLREAREALRDDA